MLRFSKWRFIVILQFFLLIIRAVWNIKPWKIIIFSPVNEWHAITFASHKADTFVMHQWCPLYRDSTVASWKTPWVQPKILVLIVNFFSLNLASIEIKGERGSERILGEGGLENEQGRTRGRGGVKTRESWANVLFGRPLT